VAPLLIVFAGLPGTGKSTLAKAIADRLPAVWLRVDVAEAAMLKAGIARSFETGLAAYLIARDLAADHLRIGHDVLIDAVNGVEPGRAMWRGVATECSATLLWVETVCSDRDEHRRRVESRPAPTPPLPLPTWQEVTEREYSPWADPVLTVDTSEPLGVCLDAILAHISRARGRRVPPGA
jgi:predicted kinase